MGNTAEDISSELDKFNIATSFNTDTDTCNKMLQDTSASLKIVTQNIRSIYKNLDNFIAQLARFKFDIDVLILTECWLNDDRSVPALNHYTLYYRKNCYNQNGGIVIYVKNNLSCSASEPNMPGANFLLLRINPDILIIAIYRSPSITCTDSFLRSIENITNLHKSTANIILTGDINIDIKNGNKDRHSESHLNLTAELGMLPGDLSHAN
jgi:exonuclease III